MKDTVQIVGLCDIDREKADRYTAQYHTTAYYSHLDMLEQSGVEAIIISVPHYDHGPIAIDAFRRSIHVMSEKPMSVHVNLYKQILAAYEEAKKQSRPAIQHHVQRENAAVLQKN